MAANLNSGFYVMPNFGMMPILTSGTPFFPASGFPATFSGMWKD
jgi:hypothetical protein